MTCIKALGEVQGSLAEARGLVGAITTSANGYVPIPMARAYGSIVCTIEGESGIRFTLSGLRWLEADNKVGTIKYNTLISTGDWSLAVVEIEELL